MATKKYGPKVVSLQPMTRPTRISYGVFALTLVLVGWLHLAVPLLAVLFSCFALNKLHFARSRWLAVLLFIVVVVGVAYGGARFIKAAVVALPTILSMHMTSAEPPSAVPRLPYVSRP